VWVSHQTLHQSRFPLSILSNCVTNHSHFPGVPVFCGPSQLTKEMEQRISDNKETSDRVNAQNIALADEVATMKKQVAVLRDEKAAMARRMRALMTAQESRKQ
jgi:hypothetical protein